MVCAHPIQLSELSHLVESLLVHFSSMMHNLNVNYLFFWGGGGGGGGKFPPPFPTWYHHGSCEVFYYLTAYNI